MVLITLRDLSLSFGGHPLLDGIDFDLREGDRACLVGRNGEGKTSLLRLLGGELKPDGGTFTFAPGAWAAYLPQEVPCHLRGTTRDVVAAGLTGVPSDGTKPVEARIDRVLSLVQVNGAAPFETLSGGLKRRALLARALVGDPPVLLLDEPTNHVDIAFIEWLETFIKRYVRTVLFVTHDRVFLRRLATRIVCLDRGRLSDWSCDYDTFLRRRQDWLDDETARNVKFDKKLSREEIWIRQGIKARRTRDEGRVRALEAMRRERAARRDAPDQVRIRLPSADPSGQLVVRAEGVRFGYGKTPIIKDLTTTIMRGDKVGIIGPNGCGKTTLLRLLLGPHAASVGDEGAVAARTVLDHRDTAFSLSESAPSGLQPQAGTIRRGARIAVAYFDQHRRELDENASVFDNIGRGADTIVINGQPRHLYGYLQEFLFPPDRARCPVSVLSGGERNRLLLARLFARPANLLVMDEPTNDLDVETLELLEERLVAYTGTLLLVSHDREFLNRVATSTLVFEGEGVVGEYVGGYDDWLARRAPAPVPVPAKPAAGTPPPVSRPRPRRLSFSEMREREALPRQIEALESEQAELHVRMADPAHYRQAREDLARLAARADELSTLLDSAYGRWAELEAIEQATRRPKDEGAVQEAD